MAIFFALKVRSQKAKGSLFLLLHLFKGPTESSQTGEENEANGKGEQRTNPIDQWTINQRTIHLIKNTEKQSKRTIETKNYPVARKGDGKKRNT